MRSSSLFVFAGKSYLLVVLILFLTRVLGIADPTCQAKIMIATLTNVAGEEAQSRALWPERRWRKVVGLLTVLLCSSCLCPLRVDGILLGLQKVGVDFVRVGSLRRVAPPIIRHMVHMNKSTEKVGKQVNPG